METTAEEKVKFFDPHFHIFDRENGPFKGTCAELWEWMYPEAPQFLIADYEKLILEDDRI